MRVNVDWLRDWVDIGWSAADLAERLTTAGLEVEEVLDVAPGSAGLVIAEVSGVQPHPAAERLRVCDVNDGRRGHRVVCGAPNVAAGAKVVFAPSGACLPGGRRIAAAEIRGVSSEGMLCSAAELGLGDEAGGLLLLDEDAPVGAAAGDYLHMDDAVLDISLTPNRGDCFSILGIAREISALAKRPLKPARLAAAVPAAGEHSVAVKLAAPERCPRFAGRVIRGLRPGGRSPLWMRERLRRAGLRPLQPIVDVTNYVMLELGQPLHAYDLNKLDGGIAVRTATPGEALTLLDERALELDEDTLVIADASGAIGLAGIMGGSSTAVDAGTQDVFLEAAFFAPEAIAGRARRYGLQTDASQRFERGVDPEQQARAIELATALLLSIGGGDPGPTKVTTAAEHLPHREPILLRAERLARILGTPVDAERVVESLQGLGMSLTERAEGWHVSPPPFRFDIAIEEDLIEEVGRVIGYDNIPAVAGAGGRELGTASELQVDEDRIADTLVARGYTEIVTYGFVDETLQAAVNPEAALVRLSNPISQDMGVMRRSLWPGLLATAQHNLSRQRARLRVFELGRQFEHGEGRPIETLVLAGLAAGAPWPEQWSGEKRDTDFFDVKGDVEALLALTACGEEFAFSAAEHPALAPGQTARILRGSKPVGWLGLLHPELEAKLDLKRNIVLFALGVEAAFAAKAPAFRAYSRFPFIRRDLALVVEEGVSAAAIVEQVKNAAGVLLQNVVVFDVYRGTGIDSRRKSVALGLILQGASRTLTDVEADQAVRSVALQLERELGATIRTQQADADHGSHES